MISIDIIDSIQFPPHLRQRHYFMSFLEFCLYYQIKPISFSILVYFDCQIKNQNYYQQCLVVQYQMKHLIEFTPPALSQKQQLCLPHLRTKSLSMPSSKIQSNFSSRYNQKISGEFVLERQSAINRKSIVNLQQIQRKGKSEQIKKLLIHQQKRKILSQYESTVDLWKQKHAMLMNYQRKQIRRQKNSPNSYSPQPNSSTANFQNLLPNGENMKNAIQQQKKNELAIIKNYNKKHALPSHSHLKIRRKKQVATQLPDEVVVSKIKQHKRLKKDDKLESILKKQVRDNSLQHIKRIYKSPVPAIGTAKPNQHKNTQKQQQKIQQNDGAKQTKQDKDKNGQNREQLYKPSQWETEKNTFTDQQFLDHF